MAQRKTGKRAERIAIEDSFGSVAGQWLDHWQHGKSSRHVDSTKHRLAANIPSLGSRPMAEIEAPEVVAMVRLIDDRGARDIAKRALETTGRISVTGSPMAMLSATRQPRFGRATS